MIFVQTSLINQILLELGPVSSSEGQKISKPKWFIFVSCKWTKIFRKESHRQTFSFGFKIENVQIFSEIFWPLLEVEHLNFKRFFCRHSDFSFILLDLHEIKAGQTLHWFWCHESGHSDQNLARIPLTFFWYALVVPHKSNDLAFS